MHTLADIFTLNAGPRSHRKRIIVLTLLLFATLC